MTDTHAPDSPSPAEARVRRPRLPHGPILMFAYGHMTSEMADGLARQRRDQAEMVVRGSAVFFGD